MKKQKKLSIALVVDHLMQLGGAERVLLELANMFPDAPIYTLFCDRKNTKEFKNYKIITLINSSLIAKLYKPLIVLYPWFFRQFNLKKYDMVISITSALAKCIKTNPNQTHLCYCNTPTRYLWIEQEEYIKTSVPKILQPIFRLLVPYLKKQDFQASQQVDFFIANSREVQTRIKKIYHRQSIVIYPPVDTEKFMIKNTKQNFYLMTGRLVPYKRFDIAIEAFVKLPNNELIIAGNGPELKKLKKNAPSNVKFLGRVTEGRLINLYRNARAYIFTPLEDFGIAPVESMSAGTPVIAYGAGGALETVADEKSGIFFKDQSPQSLISAIIRFNRIKFLPTTIRQTALKFSKKRFKIEMKKLINKINNKYGA